MKSGQYYLTFHSDVECGSIDGYIWSLLVQAYCRANKMSLAGASHDPESDSYSAIAQEMEPLEKISEAIDALLADDSLREDYISRIGELDQSQDDDDLTTKEYLEWMTEAEYDMTVPQTFTFDLDGVKDAEQARVIQSEIEKKGYKTKVEIIDGEVFFEVIVKTEPTLNVVLDIESYLESVALTFDAKYIGFGT